ncbi:MAG: hypothetical protein E7057_08100 [Lentisphaerae bacterium]|nr:hypothetical protein [Lentisphaerota bacterium]
MVLLAKFIRMRTARSAATASHPGVEYTTEDICFAKRKVRAAKYFAAAPFFAAAVTHGVIV